MQCCQSVGLTQIPFKVSFFPQSCKLVFLTALPFTAVWNKPRRHCPDGSGGQNLFLQSEFTATQWVLYAVLANSATSCVFLFFPIPFAEILFNVQSTPVNVCLHECRGVVTSYLGGICSLQSNPFLHQSTKCHLKSIIWIIICPPIYRWPVRDGRSRYDLRGLHVTYKNNVPYHDCFYYIFF